MKLAPSDHILMLFVYSNGVSSQVPAKTLSEEQEVTLEMYDDSADHEHIDDDDLGDQLLLEVLRDYDNVKLVEQTGKLGYENLTITQC